MSITRRATVRAFSALGAVAAVLILATCDLGSLSPKDPNAPDPEALKSTDLTLAVTGGPSALAVTLGGTATANVTSTKDLTGVIKRYATGNSSIIAIDTSTGLLTGVSVGTTTITAKVLAPELGEGVSVSQAVRVRYKAIKITAPVVTDSIQGLGPAQNRTVTVFGTNNANANAASPIATVDSIRSRDTTIFRVSGTTISARKNGSAQLVAFFDGFRDSVAVRVRQVAKSVTFPTTNYTARHVNFNLTVPLTVKDVTDSLIPTPTATWSTKDTTKATVGTTTGLLKVKTIAVGVGDSVVVVTDSIRRAQRILVSQVVGSLTKFQGDARSDTVAKDVTVVPTVTAVDSGLTPVVGASVQFKLGLNGGGNAALVDTFPVTTDALGRAKPTSWKLGDVAAANNNTIIATSGVQSTTFTVTGIAGQPRKLAFSVNPVNIGVGGTISPSVVVQVRDSLNNLVATANNSITISLSNNPGGATLGGTLTASAINGVATFAGLTLNATGTGYALQAATSGLTSVISNGFDVFGTKKKLGFTSQPQTTTAGTTLPAVRVAIQDSAGAIVTTATDSVSIAILANPASGTLTGGGKAAAVAGIATFSNLSINNAGNGYTLQGTASGLTAAASNSFNMTAVGSPAKLVFAQQPTDVQSGAAIGPSMTVRVLDANGALVTTSTQQITLSIDPSSPSGGAINAGTTSQNAVGGIATFPGIQINKANAGYRLLATATGTTLTTAISNSFNVTPGSASKLAFLQGPVNTTGGSTMPVAVTVEVQDVNNNRVTSAAVPVTIALTSATCTGATLTGGGTVNSVNGVATYASLGLSAVATNNCTLTATATSLSTATSGTFTSNAASAAARLRWTAQPTASGTAGSVISAMGTVNVQDAAGNNTSATSAVSMTLAVASGPSTTISTCSLTQANTSSVTYTNCMFATAGTYKLVVSATGYRPDTSANIVISAGAASKLAFLTQPSSATAGVPFASPIQVVVQDANSNTVTGSSAVVTLSTSLQQSPFTSGRWNNGNLTSITATASSGVATFTNLAQYTQGIGYRMFASATSLSNVSSNYYDVASAPATKLGFVVQPQSTATTSVALSPDVQVSAQDSVGNTAADFGAPITLALTGGTAGATLGGTKTITPASTGISTFTGMSVDRMGTSYQLSASATGVASGTSNTFNVDPITVSNASGGVCCQSKQVIVGGVLYFAHNNALKSVPVGGTSVTTIVGSTNAAQVATDGTNIFWVERGTNNNGDAFIKKYTIATTTVSTLTVAQTTLMNDDVAKLWADGTNVYFVARNAATTGYAIKSVGVNAVSATPTEIFNPGDFNNRWYFIVSGGMIYWYDAAFGQVRRMTTTGASVTTLTSGTNNAQRLALAGTTLFFNDGVNIRSVPNATTAVGPVAPTAAFTGPGTVYDITANGGQLYFNFDATIRRYNPADLTTFATLGASANQSYWNIEFDGTYMYWMRFSQWVRVPK